MGTFGETAENLRFVLRNLQKLVVLGETIHQMASNGMTAQTGPLIQKRAGIIQSLQQYLQESESAATTSDTKPDITRSTTIDPALMSLYAAVLHTRRRLQSLDKAIAGIIEKEKAEVLAKQQAANASLKMLRQFMPYYLKESSQLRLTA